MRKIFIFAAMYFIWPVYAASVIEAEIPNAKQVASARLSVFIFDIYDASFYTPEASPTFQPPFALKLSYLRDIDGEDIADRSAKEMRIQSKVNEVKLADWHAQMRSIFPNVAKGDHVAGIYKEKSQCHFYKNDQHIGQVNDREFCEVFFNIWFGEQTTAPKLRNRVLKKQQEAALMDR